MAESNILTWNFANWLTVVIMVALAFALIGAGVKVYQQKKSVATA